MENDEKCVCKHEHIFCRNKHGNLRRRLEISFTSQSRVFKIRRKTKCAICGSSEVTDPAICMVLYHFPVTYENLIKPKSTSLVLMYAEDYTNMGFVLYTKYHYSLIFPMCCKHTKDKIFTALQYKGIGGFCLLEFPSSRIVHHWISDDIYYKGIRFCLAISKVTLRCTYCRKFITHQTKDDIVTMSTGKKAEIFCGKCYHNYKSDPTHDRYSRITEYINKLDQIILEYKDLIGYIEDGDPFGLHEKHSFWGFAGTALKETHTHKKINYIKSYYIGDLAFANEELLDVTRMYVKKTKSTRYYRRSVKFSRCLQKYCIKRDIRFFIGDNFSNRYLRAVNAYILRHRFTEDGVYKV